MISELGYGSLPPFRCARKPTPSTHLGLRLGLGVEPYYWLSWVSCLPTAEPPLPSLHNCVSQFPMVTYLPTNLSVYLSSTLSIIYLSIIHLPSYHLSSIHPLYINHLSSIYHLLPIHASIHLSSIIFLSVIGLFLGRTQTNTGASPSKSDCKRFNLQSQSSRREIKIV